MGGDAKIPYGRTTSGAEHDILDSEAGLNYFCPECQYRLERRFGPKLQYFAHLRGAHDGRCPWLSGTHTPESLRDEAIRTYSTSGRMRLFVVRDPYVDAALLRGAIPGITREDAAIAREHGALSIAHQAGLHQKVGLGSLNSDSITYVDLDPSAEKYILTVTGPKLVRAVGQWQAPPLQRGDVFIGDEETAELIRRPTRVASGECVYVVARLGDNGPHGAKKLALGNHTLVMTEANPLTLDYLRDYVPNLQLDDYPMRVNVVLPLDLHPQAERFIRVPHGTPLLLSIVPPIDSDPEFEVIPIPLRSESYHLPRMGKGVARLVKLTVRKEQPVSLLIHWPGRVGRDKFLDVGTSDGHSARLPSFQEAEIGCYVIRGEGKIFASSLETESLDLVLEIDAEDGLAPEEVFLRTPGDMRVGLAAEVLDGDSPIRREQGEATTEDFTERVKALFAGGARTVWVAFGPLGRVTIRCAHFYDRALRAIEEARHREAREAAERNAAIAARKARQQQQAAEAAARADRLEAQRVAEARAIMERTEQLMRERAERERAANLERERQRQEARRIEAERAAQAAAAVEAERQHQLKLRERASIEALITRNLKAHEGEFPHRASLTFAARMMELPPERVIEAEPWRNFTRRMMREIARTRPRRSRKPPPATGTHNVPTAAAPFPPQPTAVTREVAAEPPADKSEVREHGRIAPVVNQNRTRATARESTLAKRQEALAELRSRRAAKREAKEAAAHANQQARKNRLRIAAAERAMRTELGERYRHAVRVLKDRAPDLPDKAEASLVTEIFQVSSEDATVFLEKYAEVVARMLKRARGVEEADP